LNRDGASFNLTAIFIPPSFLIYQSAQKLSLGMHCLRVFSFRYSKIPVKPAWPANVRAIMKAFVRLERIYPQSLAAIEVNRTHPARLLEISLRSLLCRIKDYHL
jgi:hypothetical protein